MKNDAYTVFEEMPHPTSINDQGTEVVLDEYGSVALDVSLGSEFTKEETLIEEDNEPSQMLLQKHVEHDEGKVVDDGIVPSLFDLQVSLGLGDKPVNVSSKSSAKAWLEQAASIIEFVLGENSMKKDVAMEILFGEIVVFMFDPGISSMFDEMLKSFQGAEQVNDLYGHDVKLIKHALFDSSGGRNGVVCISRRDTHPLLGKSQQMFVFAFKGIIPSPWHANSFIDVVLEMMFGEMVVFLFDPGIGYWPLKVINGLPMKQTYTGKLDHFDVFLKMLVDYSNFALLIPIYLTQNGLHLCDLVMPFSLFMQINSIMLYFYGVYEHEFPCRWKLSSSYDIIFWIVEVLSQNDILLYILEDKDGFEGLERKILAMVMIRSIKYDQTDRKCGSNKACKPLRQLLFLVSFSSHGQLFCCSLVASKTGDNLAAKMVIHRTSGVLSLSKQGQVSNFELHRHDDEARCGLDCILHYLPSVNTPASFFDVRTNLNREFLRSFEDVIISIINDYVSLHYLPCVSAAAALISVMRNFEPPKLMQYHDQFMDALRLRSINHVTEMKGRMVYDKRISSEPQQLVFCYHSVSFLAIRSPCCVLGCFILMLWLVWYKCFSYDLGSYTILDLENTCLVNFDPTGNVVQGAEN